MGNGRELGLEDHVRHAMARLQSDIVDLDAEAERWLAMVRFVREVLQRDLASGSGGKHGLPDDSIKRLKDFSSIFESAVACQVKLDTTADKRQKRLKTEDFLVAARKLVMAQPTKVRNAWLREAVLEHVSRRAFTAGPPAMIEAYLNSPESRDDDQPEAQ